MWRRSAKTIESFRTKTDEDRIEKCIRMRRQSLAQSMDVVIDEDIFAHFHIHNILQWQEANDRKVKKSYAAKRKTYNSTASPGVEVSRSICLLPKWKRKNGISSGKMHMKMCECFIRKIKREIISFIHISFPILFDRIFLVFTLVVDKMRISTWKCFWSFSSDRCIEKAFNFYSISSLLTKKCVNYEQTSLWMKWMHSIIYFPNKNAAKYERRENGCRSQRSASVYWVNWIFILCHFDAEESEEQTIVRRKKMKRNGNSLEHFAIIARCHNAASRVGGGRHRNAIHSNASRKKALHLTTEATKMTVERKR